MRRKWKSNRTWLSLVLTAAAGLVCAQSPSPGSEPPKLHGETLDGKMILLPEAAAGKVTLLVIGASKSGSRPGTSGPMGGRPPGR